MPRKIFISYKHSDSDVRAIPPRVLLGAAYGTTARSYVDELERLLVEVHDHIYKGENDNESLQGFKDDTIASKLRGKIFDSTITIVLISKNMKDPAKSEDNQWIPWEISYSLKEMTKEGRTSGTNAMVAVIIPDRAGSYEHFIKKICTNGCQSYQTSSTFKIIAANMFNRGIPKTFNCAQHPASGVHTGNDHSYIYPVKWDDFISNINGHLGIAVEINQTIDSYNVTKTI